MTSLNLAKNVNVYLELSQTILGSSINLFSPVEVLSSIY